MNRELVAAGITDPGLRDSYRRCRDLHARHGRTFFLATRLLPPASRPAVHALYGFARWVDDLVDQPGVPDPAAALDRVAGTLSAGLAAGRTGHPLLAAVVHTAGRYEIPAGHFTDFMAAMRMDLTVTGYADFDQLAGYTHGSAGVIGLQVLPVLGTVVAPAVAAPPAAALGVAFQLTNFVRDVGEDLDRGRVYLPADVLAAFGVDRALLTWCRRTGRTDRRVRRALAHVVAHTAAVYRRAAPGIGLLAPQARPCVAAACTLYRGILDRVVAADYDVLNRRVVVPAARRVAVATPAVARSLLARARSGTPNLGSERHRLGASPDLAPAVGPQRGDRRARQ